MAVFSRFLFFLAACVGGVRKNLWKKVEPLAPMPLWPYLRRIQVRRAREPPPSCESPVSTSVVAG